MKKIVITGATSTIGLAMLELCIEQNIEVLAIINPVSTKIHRIPRSELITVRTCELSEVGQMGVSTLGQYDAFIHLAWVATAGDEERNKLEKQAANIQYSLAAVELAQRLGCEVFVGAGSQAEYGRKEEMLTETLEACPETAYGMAKLCAGQMTRLSCQQKGIRHIWPRILSTYGPGSQYRTVINYTICELLEGRSPSLTGGEQWWDFLYVKDAARAMLMLAEKGRDGEIYLVGQGQSDYLYHYLEIVRQTTEAYMGKQMPALGLGEKPYTEQTVMHLSCDIGKLKRDTGFVPTISFEEGIQKTIQWILKEHLIG